MSIEAELLSSYELIDSEKTSFRLKPPLESGRSPNASFQMSTQYTLYQEYWKKADLKILQIVGNLQSDLLQELITFIKFTKFNFDALIRQPIPTAILLGASKILNASLAIGITKLRDPLFGRPECIPVQLNSRSCLTLSSTIKHIVNILENQLERLAHDDDDGPSYHHHPKNARGNDPLAKDDVQNIRILYQALCDITQKQKDLKTSSHLPSSSSQATAAAETDRLVGPKLIFIIDDFEGFDSGVLEDLILILSNLIVKIPIVLVLSINTSAEAIHSLLPRTLIFRLRMTPFAVDMGGETVASLIQMISFDPEIPFDLSSGVIRSLMDGYERLNKSIDSLVSKLQFMYLAYFHTNPLSVFLHERMVKKGGPEVIDDGAVAGVVVPPNFEHLALHLRLTNSWQKRHRRTKGSSNDPCTTTTMTHDDDDREVLRILLDSYCHHRPKSRQFTLISLQILQIIGTFWPEKRRTNEWILYNSFRTELLEYAMELCKLIKHSNDEMIANVLNSLVGFKAEFEWLEPSLSRLSELIVDDQIRQAGGRTHLVNTHEPVLSGITLYPADREFSQIISDITSSLIDFFRKHLGPECLLDLHEAWSFDDKILVNEVFHPRYIHQIKSGLASRNDNQEEEEDHGKGARREGVEEQVRGLRRMYELYMETNGKVINLHDWYGAFEQTSQRSQTRAVRDDGDEDSRTPKKRKKNQAVGLSDPTPTKKKDQQQNEGHLLERSFLRSIGDLGFLGLISSCSQRKKEHVTKVFFGC